MFDLFALSWLVPAVALLCAHSQCRRTPDRPGVGSVCCPRKTDQPRMSREARAERKEEEEHGMSLTTNTVSENRLERPTPIPVIRPTASGSRSAAATFIDGNKLRDT